MEERSGNVPFSRVLIEGDKATLKHAISTSISWKQVLDDWNAAALSKAVRGKKRKAEAAVGAAPIVDQGAASRGSKAAISMKNAKRMKHIFS